MFIQYVSGFPNWYMVMRRQTSGRETQICSYKCNIFVDKITTAATISTSIKHVT